MDVEGGEPGREAEQRTDLVIHAGIIRAVGDVEAFSSELQTEFLTQFVLPAQAHVEVNVVWTEAGVARGSNGTFVGNVVVSVDGPTRQQIERMAAVVLENRRELEAGQDSAFPGAVNHSGEHDFVPFVKF